jgi:hypothetical protein
MTFNQVSDKASNPKADLLMESFGATEINSQLLN